MNAGERRPRPGKWELGGGGAESAPRAPERSGQGPNRAGDEPRCCPRRPPAGPAVAG